VARPARVAAAVVCAVVVSLVPRPARALDAVVYTPPVDAPIVDGFRPPPTPYGPGNRGLEYAVPDLSPVRAAADGEVIFAGYVAGTLHVTIRHADALRTSYSFLTTVTVARGARLRRGDVIGRVQGRLHFGVRDPTGTYLDPALLFSGSLRTHARLVPGVEEGRPPLDRDEREGFLRLVLDRAANRMPLVLHYAVELRPDVRLAHVVERLARLSAQQQRCTPAGTSPLPAGGRRIVVLVGGLGSTVDAAAIDRVDTTALGIAGGDVLRFSYRGGRVPDTSDGAEFSSIVARPYAAIDTTIDLNVVADRLEGLLLDVAAAAPGIPIDVIGHSQGGVVARLSIGRADAKGRLPGQVATLATLGSPHRGADLATAADAAQGLPPPARSVLDAAGYGSGAVSVRQLSEVSSFVGSLDDHPLPPRIARVSIAARGDLVVPSPRTAAADFPNVVVDVGGLGAHDELPGSPAVTRELALVQAGQPPTCASPDDLVLDAITGEAISWATDALGASLLSGAGSAG
jgi:hypothetical protein